MAAINVNAPLTPFDNEEFIDMSTSDGVKKYKQITTGLKEKFDLSKQSLPNFLELLRIELQNFRLLKVFNVVTDRPTAGTVTVANYFDDPSLATKAQIQAHAANVWERTAADQRPLVNHPGLVIGTAQERRDTITEYRNIRMQKTEMVWHLIYNSCTNVAQTELATKSNDYTFGGYCDGLCLLEIIFSKLSPSTAIGTDTYKKQLEKADIATFNNDVTLLCDFFSKTKRAIEKAGDRKYKEYRRLLFDSLETANCDEFVMLTKLDRDKFHQGLPGFNFGEIIATATKRYNDLLATNKFHIKTAINNEVVALNASLLEVKKELSSLRDKNTSNDNKGPRNNKRRRIKQVQTGREWCFEGHGDKKTIEKNGKTYHACKKCGERYGKDAMWVLHEVHQDIAPPRNNVERPTGLRVNQDLKTAMMAATTQEDVESLLAQFNVKD